MDSADSWESSYYSESLETISSAVSERSSFNMSSENTSKDKYDDEPVNNEKEAANISSKESYDEIVDSSFGDHSIICNIKKNKIRHLSTSTEEEEEEEDNLLSTEEPFNNQNHITNMSSKESIEETVDNSVGNPSLTAHVTSMDNVLEASTTSEVEDFPLQPNEERNEESISNNTVLVKDNAKFNQSRCGPIIDSATSSESEDDADIVDVSSDGGMPIVTPKKQLTLPQMTKKLNNQTIVTKQTDNVPIVSSQQNHSGDSIIVSQLAYDEQHTAVKKLQEENLKIRNLLHTINLDALPDRGKALCKKQQDLENAIMLANAKFSKMVVNEDLTIKHNSLKPAAWEDLKVMSESVQPKTFGERALATINAQKALTMDRLQHLHNSLTSCPTEDTYAEEPKGLKVELMPHQKHALSWLLWRESQKPSGGILADDMGLGKTLTMISLMLKSRELKKNLDDESDSDEEDRQHNNSKYQGGTLVVCPASLLKQWESEVDKHCKKYLVSIELYHGPKRETRAKILAKRNMVITTYAICMNEVEKRTPLYQVRWKRIILDEAHQVRNYKSQTSVAVCALYGQSRWALTGTPVHNKEADMYSLLKFLRCSPFDDLAVWKRWVGNKSSGGQDRLNTVLASIMLRRTKVALQEKGALRSLPERSFETICVHLQAQEQAVYQKILIFSRTLFAQYLHQHVEKENNYASLGQYAKQTENPQNAYFKMHQKMLKLNKVKEVKSHEILVLLLRLRQMCCHPSLVVKMLESDQLDAQDDIEGHEEFDILKEMEKLNVNDTTNDWSFSKETEDENCDKAIGVLLNPNNPLFSENRKSTKFDAVLTLLNEKILPTNEKAIIVSQWTSLLRLLGLHLKANNIPFDQLDGSVAVAKRMTLVHNFNSRSHPVKILLLSLTAGGVGLNLTGGNHMLLLDLHWNPQLEMQAQDRIYRVGQERKVHIYKFMALNTIEERINKLQEQKLSLANSMLTGSKGQHMKLSLHDLRMLFNM